MTIAIERPQKSKSAQIREKLGYPIIDTDVHKQEFPPAFLDYLDQVGGTAIAEKFQEKNRETRRCARSLPQSLLLHGNII
ncbi:hypothetical protein [Anabaena azotica]|uniref:hypothetical protein n=1 Tax=Anabaena azotica TaxID=197653 RepID=UPI001F553554|nr:hypothetical protein [Anabaena azotica]